MTRVKTNFQYFYLQYQSNIHTIFTELIPVQFRVYQQYYRVSMVNKIMYL